MDMFRDERVHSDTVRWYQEYIEVVCNATQSGPTPDGPFFIQNKVQNVSRFQIAAAIVCRLVASELVRNKFFGRGRDA